MAATKMKNAKTTSKQANALKWNRGTERPRDGQKGTKPVSEPMTVQEMAVVLVMHGCRRVVLMDTMHKVALYGAVLMLGSVLCDFFPLPKNVLWQKTSLLNRYFSKLSWGWTMLAVGAFVYLTSFVYCCGNMVRIQRHMSRLVVGTISWYLWTMTFTAFEAATGYCIGPSDPEARVLGHDECLKQGFRWRGFDVSGHVFLLMYCGLIIHEEAKSIKGWERIKDLIRDVDHDEDSALAVLSADELELLKASYDKYGVYVKSLFVALTVLSVIWDFQLLGTILYYHSLAQKVAAGIIAIATWFATYRMWYLTDQSPGLPGQGTFKVANNRATAESRRRSLVVGRPKITRNGQTVDFDEKTA